MKGKLLFHAEYKHKYKSIFSYLDALIFPLILFIAGIVILILIVKDGYSDKDNMGFLISGGLLLMTFIVWPFPKYTIDLYDEYFTFRISPKRVGNSNGSFTYFDIRNWQYKKDKSILSIELKNGTGHSLNLSGMNEDEKDKFFEVLKSKHIK